MKPITFSAPMVRAILEGRKTQTRRVVRGIPECARLVSYTAESDQSELAHSLGWFEEEACDLWPCNRADRIRCPYGQPGDLLWVREPFNKSPDGVIYRATVEEAGMLEPGDSIRWVSPLFMPKSYSRLTLRVTEVRAQRLQDISEDDAIAEGCRGSSGGPWGCEGLIEDFSDLWDRFNAKRGHSWDSNPWVWAITFEPLPGEGS